VQKFSSDGIFVAKWGNWGAESGKLDLPQGIALDSSGNVYVAGPENFRVQVFSPDGVFIAKWGSKGSGDGEFYGPQGLAIDETDNVYVADSGNHRIQKFSAEGRFMAKWGASGSGDGEFAGPWGIAVDDDGGVYVADTWNNRIQRFSRDGVFERKWGSSGSGNGEFNEPRGVAIDSTGNIYVADTENDRIQKFNPEGVFITKWDMGALSNPRGIVIDTIGDVYVAVTYGHHIGKYSAAGVFISSFGQWGTDPGSLNSPNYLAVSSSGRIYASDRLNCRIQVFREVPSGTNDRAIIVAGGGAYAGNNLWEATQMSANFAYRTLTYRGFIKETICYLTSDTDLDLDNNDVLDDVDADAANANLKQAVTNWAMDANDVVIYLVDHGGSGTFRMSGMETLSATDLDTWLDTLQATIPGKVMVIYDACESGSFVSELTSSEGKERILVTSTSAGEAAKFVTQGSVSFSNYFWTHIFNGLDIKNAFGLTSNALTSSFDDQHPLIDANGNGVGNEAEDLALVENVYIGNGTVIQGNTPMIGSVSSEQTITGTNSATLSATNVTDNDGIARVWAVIRPPDYRQGSSGNPVQDLPSVDLMPQGNNQYEATYDQFSVAGTYQIAIYARDRIGNTSIPKTTAVIVDSPLRRRAVVVAGGEQSDVLWPALEQCARSAYEGLSFQGYSDDDIYLMAPASIPGVTKLTLLPTLSNIEYAIATWASQDTMDLVVYLVGNGANGSFRVNDAEQLSRTDLDTWLDTLQVTIPGKVSLIYDAAGSGSFIPSLTPAEGKERLTLCSSAASQPAFFLSDGDISFSKFFWSRVANGANLRDSFIHSKKAMSYLTDNQVPQIDDNGNGIPNEKVDGYLSQSYTLGVGIMLAGDDPLIGSVSPEQALNSETSATIWAKDVTTTGTIDRVWAVITPPNAQQTDGSVIDLPSVDLIYNDVSERYEGICDSFSDSGSYGVTIYAQDAVGSISMPKQTRVTKASQVKGDVDGDGDVDLTDALIALKAVVGMDTTGLVRSDYAASGVDVNVDNDVNLAEAIYILRELSGTQAMERIRSPLAYDSSPAYEESDLDALVNGFGDFTIDFYHEVTNAAGSQGKNIFFSAYSIENALAMTWTGAHGSTASQMAEALHLNLAVDTFHSTLNALNVDINSRDDQSPPSGDPFQLNLVNAIWSRIGYPFLSSYLDIIALNYDAGILALDFVQKPEGSRQVINRWVEKQTNEKIVDLLPIGSITPDTALVLTNAIYFRGSWFSKFDESATVSGDFTRLDGSTAAPQMMHQRLDTRIYQGANYDALGFPYASPRFEEWQYPEELSMLFIVPHEGQFAAVEEGLDRGTIDMIVSSLQVKEVDLSLPKFSYEFKVRCKSIMINLGMVDAFIPSAADFSGMVDPANSKPWIAEIYHKAFVAIDEQGTEAAAATAVVMTDTAVPQPIVFSVDKPFIFLIRDDITGLILFMGRVLDPTA